MHAFGINLEIHDFALYGRASLYEHLQSKSNKTNLDWLYFEVKSIVQNSFLQFIRRIQG